MTDSTNTDQLIFPFITELPAEIIFSTGQTNKKYIEAEQFEMFEDANREIDSNYKLNNPAVD